MPGCFFLNRTSDELRIKVFQTSLVSSQLPLAWSKWKRDLECYFESEKICSQYDKRSKLLYLGGSDLRDVYDNLPEVETVSHVLSDPPYYDVAIAKLDAHFEPYRRRTYERHLFRQIAQGPSERFSDFVLRLRTQVKRCEYDKPEEMILDQIVEKCSSAKLKQKMLKRDLLLSEVEGLGTSLEESARKLKEFISSPRSPQSDHIGNVTKKLTGKYDAVKKARPGLVNRSQAVMKGFQRSISVPVCFSCGNRGHVKGADICPAKDKSCLKCGGTGHFAKQCRKRANNEERTVVPPKRIRAVFEDLETEKEEDYIFYAMGKNTFLFKVGGVEIPMIIDSGAAANIISLKVWEQMKQLKVHVRQMSTEIDRHFTCYASNKPMVIMGSFDAEIEGGGRKVDAKFYVAKEGQQCLLGDQTAKLLHVLKVGFDIGNISQASKAEFPKFKGVTVEIPIDNQVQPVQQAYRRVPYALEEKVDEKIRLLLDQGIIEKVNGPSPWVSPIVPVLKDSGDVRLCVDMRQANRAVIRETHPLPLVDEILGSVSGAKYFSKVDVKDAYHQVEISERSRPITTFITKTGLYR